MFRRQIWNDYEVLTCTDDKRFQKKHFEKAEKQCRPLLLSNENRVCSLNLHGCEDVKLEQLSLIDPDSEDEFDIDRISHCDVLLICISKERSTVVVCFSSSWRARERMEHIFTQIWLFYSEPYRSNSYEYLFLSLVRDEKLSVLVRFEDNMSKTEIWLTNKIDDTTKHVSWTNWMWVQDHIDFDLIRQMVLCIGWEDSITTHQLGLGRYYGGCVSAILNYFPSLVQISEIDD